jgi:outer membrane protein
MLARGWPHFVVGPAAISVCAMLACEAPPRGETGADMTARRAQAITSARLAQSTQPEAPSEPPARMVGSAETQPAISMQDFLTQVPDPRQVRQVLETELDRRLREPGQSEQQKAQFRSQFDRDLKNTLARSDAVRRPKSAEITLPDMVKRALKHSYLIQSQSYNPAIESTRIVEAEAQFDAVFFTNFTYNKQDRPGVTKLLNTESDTRVYEGGIRKLLSTGATVQAAYNLTRTSSNLAAQTMNPQYFNQFAVDFRQPLLRGFGLDFNRAQIELRRLERARTIEELRRSIRETIFNVEQAYWRLMQARRDVTISARLLTDLEGIFDALKQRLEVGYDVYIVQVKQTESRIEQRRAEFIRLKNDVRNAEDALKRLVNEPKLNQATDIELIPMDTPSMEPLVLDQLGEITAGLINRPELHATKIAIEEAQLQIGVAKNQALPKLDLTFRYVIDGLGSNPDRAFSQLSENDFNEYLLQLQFEWPIGNRGPEAALRRARLQQAQSIATHRDQIEGVINDVNTAIRDLQTNYDQIGPSLRAALASQEQLEATTARLERLDPPALEVLLNAQEALATARQSLIQVVANYNIALINLERQKGTLLEYNNIVVRGVDEDCYLKPYQPLIP